MKITLPACLSAVLLTTAAFAQQPKPGAGLPPGAPGGGPGGPGGPGLGAPATPPVEPYPESLADEKARSSYALGMAIANQLKSAPSGIPENLDEVAAGIRDTIAGKVKADYSVGVSWGQKLASDKLEVDMDKLVDALKTVLGGKDGQLSQPQFQEQMGKVQQSMNERRRKQQDEVAVKREAECKEFLDKNKTAEGVKVTASGLQYKVIKDVPGPKPTAADTVSVNYKGALIDGTVFDQSKNGPATFPLTGVVKGWTEGIPLMSVGSTYRFWVPSELGYGRNPRPGGSIKPGDTLVFDVDLLEIKEKTATTTPVPANRPGATATTPPIQVEMKDGKPRATAVTPPVSVEIPPKKDDAPKKEGDKK